MVLKDLRKALIKEGATSWARTTIFAGPENLWVVLHDRAAAYVFHWAIPSRPPAPGEGRAWRRWISIAPLRRSCGGYLYQELLERAVTAWHDDSGIPTRSVGTGFWGPFRTNNCATVPTWDSGASALGQQVGTDH